MEHCSRITSQTKFLWLAVTWNLLYSSSKKKKKSLWLTILRPIMYAPFTIKLTEFLWKSNLMRLWSAQSAMHILCFRCFLLKWFEIGKGQRRQSDYCISDRPGKTFQMEGGSKNKAIWSKMSSAHPNNYKRRSWKQDSNSAEGRGLKSSQRMLSQDKLYF